MSEQDPQTTDYWSLPKSGPRTTPLNSAWTWTVLTYVFIIVIAWATASQNGFQFQGGWTGPAILAALLYPAYRVGALISRFLKQRAPDVAELEQATSRASNKQPASGSVEARMAARRARVAKAKEEGKL
ncbi:MAG: hypothetical protein AAFS03_11500 [Pseudomonadota bacterium]